MFQFCPQSKSVSIQNSPFINGRLTFQFSTNSIRSGDLSWQAAADGYIAEYHNLSFKLCTADENFLVEVCNNSTAPIQLETVTLQFSPAAMDDKLAAGDYLELIHSQNFEKQCGIKKVGQKSKKLSHNPESFMVYVLKHLESDNCHFFCELPPHRNDYISFRALHDAPHLEGDFGVEIKSDQQRLILPGKTVSTSAITYQSGTEPLQLLEEYGKRLATERKMPLKDVKIGWNSWDYFAGAVESKDLFSNQDACNDLFDGIPNCIVIDEGWEPRWGNWEANWKFPEGLDGYCRRIKEAGGSPGIWTAPLLVNGYTTIYREHPDWFGRDSNGQIVSRLLSYGPMSFLDITHPEVEEFIFNIFKRLKDEGFEYFKVDFTQMVLECSRFHDMTVGRGGIIRQTFETIRRAIGDDSYLLACGAPFQSISGLVDANRSSGDIHNFWPHIYGNAGPILTRWWQHRNLWNNDPDFLIVRTPETAPGTQLNRTHTPKPCSLDEHWLAGRDINLKEAKTYALLVYCSAGDLMLSDNLPELNETGQAIIRRLINSPLKNAARPVDLFSRHDSLPSILVAREDDHVFIAVFNWSEDNTVITLDLDELGLDCSTAKSFWNDEAIEIINGKINLKLNYRASEGIILS